jgi:L-ribulose-5-phosphate 4-epimerase
MKDRKMPDHSPRFPDLHAKMDALIASARRCFAVGLQTNAGGNLSVRLDAGDAIVIKPSGVGFAECSRENLQVVLLDGTILPSDLDLKPSKDLDFHLDLYRIRPDINAIVHCHSPWATGYASAGLEIPCLTVQTIEKIGRMPLIPLSSNGGPQTEVEISPVFADKNIRAAVLANHGTIGVGGTLMAAQYLAEIIEETAHIAFVRDTVMAAHGKTAADLPQYGTAAEARAAR